MLLKVGILVQEVALREQSWKKLKQTKNMAPNLYVTIEYGDESIRTQTVKDTLSPSFSRDAVHGYLSFLVSHFAF